MRKTPATDAAGDYVAEAFGDSPTLADELIALVLDGTKRATASLARCYTPHTDESLPAVGDHVVALDGEGTPRCIWRTREIRVGPLDSIDDAFAWDEGEGDRSRAWWLDAHRRYFQREAARKGFTIHDAIETVFERFTVVWPPQVAD